MLPQKETESHFHYFKTAIDSFSIPDKFTFPFYYQPHPLSLLAVAELEMYLENQTDFEHNFGLKGDEKETAIGKMFGVLVVQNQQNQLGYLTAFSGKLADKSLPAQFVPPVFNMRTEGSFYIEGEKELNAISKRIEDLENSTQFLEAEKRFQEITKFATSDLKAQREKLKLAKKARKAQKKLTESQEDKTMLESLLKKLQQESFNDQFYYRELHEHWETKTAKKATEFAVLNNELKRLKLERKEKSAILQQTLFGKYQFLNKDGDIKGLNAIFTSPEIKPPAGSGECSAPKLLQYAFQNNLNPIAMAEFWWGKSPNSAIRKHKNFYPACQGRCKPILSHMLAGIEMDENPLLKHSGIEKKLPIIYEDDVLLVVNKPSEFLSVPGKEIKDSVYTRIKSEYPNATGPLIVHRLDMSTSGILILSKTKEANKKLQEQFIQRTVQKKYIVLLDGVLREDEGEINLPLRVDLDDRPRQLVCYKHGKIAKTRWKVLERMGNTTKVALYPITGRTHQLRVHAAHPLGLNMPIVGDDLYGTKNTRLHLHAAFLEITHPISKEVMRFEVEVDF